MWQRVIDSRDQPHKRIGLNYDATDIELHGNQQGKFFNGYYNHYCYLRLSNIDGPKHSWGITSLLVKFIRRHRPET
jgi:hypothetical protein